MESIETIKRDLFENICTLEFTKKNGETRKLIGTTNMDYIVGTGLQEAKTEETRVYTKKNPNNISVFDVEKKAWRSFNYDSLESFYTGLAVSVPVYEGEEKGV